MEDLIKGRKEIAHAMGVSAATVTRMHNENRIPTFYWAAGLRSVRRTSTR